MSFGGTKWDGKAYSNTDSDPASGAPGVIPSSASGPSQALKCLGNHCLGEPSQHSSPEPTPMDQETLPRDEQMHSESSRSPTVQQENRSPLACSSPMEEKSYEELLRSLDDASVKRLALTSQKVLSKRVRNRKRKQLSRLRLCKRRPLLLKRLEYEDDATTSTRKEEYAGESSFEDGQRWSPPSLIVQNFPALVATIPKMMAQAHARSKYCNCAYIHGLAGTGKTTLVKNMLLFKQIWMCFTFQTDLDQIHTIDMSPA